MNLKIEGIGLPVILFIVFLVLKLCKVIAWSWWWVFSPLWMSFVIALAFVLLYVIVAVIMTLRKYRKRK